MSHDADERKNLSGVEAHWRARVREAQAHYRDAFEQHRRMLEELDQALIEPADGSFAVAEARRGMALALDQLVRSQKILVDLIQRRTVAPSDDDPQIN
jgi:hypothetical protein